MDHLESMQENFSDAIKMVETAEGSANMTVKYLPTFARFYPSAMVSNYSKDTEASNQAYVGNTCNLLCFAAYK